MRAVLLDETGLSLGEVARPEPGPGEVRVRPLACGICGSDLHLARHYAEIRDFALAQGAPPEAVSGAIVLGHEYVAEVETYGPDTAGALPPGSRVVAMPFLPRAGVPLPIGASPHAPGAFAERMLLAEALLVPVPDMLATPLAALTEPVAVAVHAVTRAGLPENAVPVVVGCGPIGLAIIGVLRQAGIGPVVASDLVAARQALAMRMGATEALGGDMPFAAAARLAPGRPVVVFDCTGARGMLARLIAAAPAGTRIVVAGIVPGEDSFVPMLAISKEIGIQFVVYYTAEEFRRALGLLGDTAVPWEAMITGEIGLAAVPETMAALGAGAPHAKVLVRPGA